MDDQPNSLIDRVRAEDWSAAAPGAAKAIGRAARKKRRRLVAAAGFVVTLVAAAPVAVGLLNGSQGRPAPVAGDSHAVSVPALHTNGWKPGDGSRQALLQATLRATPNGCLYATPSADPDPTNAASRTGLVWPAGFTARPADDGHMDVLDPNGRIVLRDGDSFSVGGGLAAGSSSDVCGLGRGPSFSMGGWPQPNS
jgi:hypothetical protein